MADVSVAVMAHPKRAGLVPDLERQLPGATVVWDKHGDRWETGSRALLAHDPDAGWQLVVQDDAILCRDFLAGVRRALAHVPDRTTASFYAGRARPHGPLVNQAVRCALQTGRPFVEMRGPLWGVAIAVPVSLIEEIVADGETRPELANYDMRLEKSFRLRGISCWYTVPSLVNHRVGPENPSLVAGRSSSPTRTAHRWIGDRSPLAIDWSRGAHRAGGQLAVRPMLTTPPPKRRPPMAERIIADRRIFGYDRHGRRVLVAAPGQPLPPGYEVPERVAKPAAEKPKPKAKSSSRARKRK